MSGTFVIVGAGLAGGGAAATLREEGFDGRVVLIGAERQPPYERPPLSKEYLRGESSFERALVQPPGFYGENGIETWFGARATRVDAADKVVELDDGERVAYDRLLVTTGDGTGASPFRAWIWKASIACGPWPTPIASARRPSRDGRRSWWGWAS